MTSPLPRVALVDHGTGNLRSVAKALERSGFAVDLSSDAATIASADAVVLPGVGAFADAAGSLAPGKPGGLGWAVQESIARGRPYLGLCLGLQLLFEEADEHGLSLGFGHFKGRVERFAGTAADGSALRVPHIGWNEVRFEGDHPMLPHLPASDHFYFVHSYRAVPSDPEIVVARTEYGAPFASAVAAANVFAVQFHPEKSQAAGKRFLDAFRAWVQETR